MCICWLINQNALYEHKNRVTVHMCTVTTVLSTVSNKKLNSDESNKENALGYCSKAT
jgi:hypothetical protein